MIPDKVISFYKKLYIINGMQEFLHPIYDENFSDEYERKVMAEFGTGEMVKQKYIKQYTHKNRNKNDYKCFCIFTKKFVKEYIDN